MYQRRRTLKKTVASALFALLVTLSILQQGYPVCLENLSWRHAFCVVLRPGKAFAAPLLPEIRQSACLLMKDGISKS